MDLDKLLPKERSSKETEDGDLLECVRKDGGTYLAPVNRQSKITGIRKWEQAFRAYATIYCAANPHRSKEIWQYIAVINTAAAAYYWENVYNYDITFRHLMAFNPNRSWAVTYNQMWNLSMKDPLPRANVQRGNSFSNASMHVNANFGNRNMNNLANSNSRRGKPDYCWNFNKGLKCKYGKSCHFIEQCSYCDSPAHGINACGKLEKRDSFSGKAARRSKSIRSTAGSSDKHKED